MIRQERRYAVVILLIIQIVFVWNHQVSHHAYAFTGWSLIHRWQHKHSGCLGDERIRLKSRAFMVGMSHLPLAKLWSWQNLSLMAKLDPKYYAKLPSLSGRCQTYHWRPFLRGDWIGFPPDSFFWLWNAQRAAGEQDIADHGFVVSFGCQDYHYRAGSRKTLFHGAAWHRWTRNNAFSVLLSINKQWTNMI